MKRLLLLGAFGLLLVGVAGVPSSAKSDTNGMMRTTNKTEYQAWITVYNFARNQMGSGWLNPGKTDTFQRCCFAAGSTYYVRAEVKGWRNGERVNIFDTQIRVTARACRTHGGRVYGFGDVILRKGHGETFFWDQEGGCPP